MGFYLIGIGGMGVKCVEVVVKLVVMGLFIEEFIKVLFVDVDEINGNLVCVRISIGIYKRIYDLMFIGDKIYCGWMKSKIEFFDYWLFFV